LSNEEIIPGIVVIKAGSGGVVPFGINNCTEYPFMNIWQCREFIMDEVGKGGLSCFQHSQTPQSGFNIREHCVIIIKHIKIKNDELVTLL